MLGAQNTQGRAPSDLRRQRCPPFLSLSVRCATSITNGDSVLAKCCSSLRSSVAPRLSLLDTKTYLMPAPRSLSSMPEPMSAG